MLRINRSFSTNISSSCSHRMWKLFLQVRTVRNGRVLSTHTTTIGMWHSIVRMMQRMLTDTCERRFNLFKDALSWPGSKQRRCWAGQFIYRRVRPPAHQVRPLRLLILRPHISRRRRSRLRRTTLLTLNRSFHNNKLTFLSTRPTWTESSLLVNGSTPDSYNQRYSLFILQTIFTFLCIPGFCSTSYPSILEIH